MEEQRGTTVDMTPDKDEIIAALNEVIREQQDTIERLNLSILYREIEYQKLSERYAKETHHES
jgi:hypothetical protein